MTAPSSTGRAQALANGTTPREADDVRDDVGAELTALLGRQDHVVSRRQAAQAGLQDHDVRRLLRRREWARTDLPGVYVDHTGALTWPQRAWAAVLWAAPAALYGPSALRTLDGPGRTSQSDAGPVHVAIDRDRVLRQPSGVRLHRIADFHGKTQANTSPPRQRIEEAVLDVAADAPDRLAAVSTIADAVRARRTTAARLGTALEGRTRLARRRFLRSVIDDVAAGTCSVLEHGYLTLVERAHGLPTAGRQVRGSWRGTVWRDVDYATYGVLVELDGRAFHDSAADRDRDLDRDLDAAVDGGRLTLRLGWGQVYGRPCLTAERIGAVMARRGWSGTPTSCARCSKDSGVPQSSDGSDPPLSRPRGSG